MPWAELQSAIAAAIVDPSLPVPREVSRPHGPDCGRFAIYRNNVVVSLTQALRDRFPITNCLVGEDFFSAMARVYAVGNLPASPVLLEYGDTFPDFIADFGPAASVPYLSDIARLEAAWSCAYHAADAVPLDTAVLHQVRPAELAGAMVELHPSLRLVRSSYPIAALWEAHQHEHVETVSEWRAEDVLILRADAAVILRTIAGGVPEFLAALLSRKNILAAGEAAVAVAPQFELGRCLVDLFFMGAIVALKPESAEAE